MESQLEGSQAGHTQCQSRNSESQAGPGKEPAKEAKNGDQERPLLELLLSLNIQQLSLSEKENILLRRQAPSKPCLQLVHAYLPAFASCCTVFTEC